MNINILYDSSMPYKDKKLNMLEQLVADMHSGNPAKINESQSVLEHLRETPDFWLQTDTILQNSSHSQTLFFALMSLHLGVKVSLKD